MVSAGWDAYGHVDVRLRSADFVNKRPGRVDDSLPHVAMGQRLHPRGQQWQAVLGVPGDMEVDLAVVVVAHGDLRDRQEARKRA